MCVLSCSCLFSRRVILVKFMSISRSESFLCLETYIHFIWTRLICCIMLVFFFLLFKLCFPFHCIKQHLFCQQQISVLRLNNAFHVICCVELQSGGDCSACDPGEEKAKRAQTTAGNGKERAEGEAEKRKWVQKKIQSGLCKKTAHFKHFYPCCHLRH